MYRVSVAELARVLGLLNPEVWPLRLQTLGGGSPCYAHVLLIQPDDTLLKISYQALDSIKINLHT